MNVRKGWEKVGNETKTTSVFIGLAAVAMGISFGGGLLAHAPTVYTRTVVHTTIAQQYGHPSTSIAGAKVNPALNGLTCDVYQSRATIICHK
jgi:hypothetical protein